MAATAAKSVSVRLDSPTYERVRRLAKQQDVSISRAIARAVEVAEREAFWRAYHEDLARLKNDPAAWAAYEAETRELEGTLADGLEPDEDWSWLKTAADAGQLDAEHMAKSG
jgi:hypothetical protein